MKEFLYLPEKTENVPLCNIMLNIELFRYLRRYITDGKLTVYQLPDKSTGLC